MEGIKNKRKARERLLQTRPKNIKEEYRRGSYATTWALMEQKRKLNEECGSGYLLIQGKTRKCFEKIRIVLGRERSRCVYFQRSGNEY